jgi:hypothetical protein
MKSRKTRLFFFRDMPQLKALKEQILPAIASKGSVQILTRRMLFR